MEKGNSRGASAEVCNEAPLPTAYVRLSSLYVSRNRKNLLLQLPHLIVEVSLGSCSSTSSGATGDEGKRMPPAAVLGRPAATGSAAAAMHDAAKTAELVLYEPHSTPFQHQGI